MEKQFTASEVRDRKRFEEWYATHSFNYSRDPIGSRDCSLQWEAWKAARADMLEAQEKAVPVAWWNKRTGQILRPHELDAIPDAPHPHSYFKKGFVPLTAHSAQAQPPAASVPGVSAQAHENAQAALAAQENPNG